MRTLISFYALFVAAALCQMGGTSLATLDALRGAAAGFTRGEIGLLGSAHFLGFAMGALLAPLLVSRSGHSRAYATMAAVGAISALLHPMMPDPDAWAGLRVLTGMAHAGCAASVESWLQSKAGNHNRGKIFGAYRVVDLSAAIAAQGLVAILDPLGYAAFSVVAIFFCLCLTPLSLTTHRPPPAPERLRLRPFLLWRISPLAFFGVMVPGLTNGAFRMIGPLYGAEQGLDVRQIASFLSLWLLGGAIAQIPFGWLADAFDRRWMLMIASAGAIGACMFMAMSAGGDVRVLMIGSFVFGFFAVPVGSLSSAHANDWARDDDYVDLAASNILVFSLGAIAGPFIAARLIDGFGPNAFFWYAAGAHVFLIVFGLYRMTRRPAPAPQSEYIHLNRTSPTLTRFLLRRNSGGRRGEDR